jgi:uncharacterized membrane protein
MVFAQGRGQRIETSPPPALSSFQDNAYGRIALMKRLLIIMAVLLISCTHKPPYSEAPVVSDEIRIDITGTGQKLPAFFSVHREGRRYDFFLQIIDGEVSSYADACLKCAPQRKGFRVEGGRLACNACGESFPLDELSGIGSCHPIPLKGELKGNTYAIKVAELIKKTRYPL